MGEITGEEEVFVGIIPYLGLVALQPVAFRFSLQVGDRFLHTGEREKHPPQAADGFYTGCAALVKPVDGRAKGFALLIHVDERGALRGERDANDILFLHTRLRQYLLAGLA